ncbi:MAG: AlpA family phage regulatory protein [Desulfobulbaceae bacterium]|nr:AlpA family phage regulatory protein [Desulfobulbaceae bacterium]
MNQNLEDIGFLRMPDVKKLTGLGRSSIYQMMADGVFPRSVAIGSRAVGWMVRDIRGWLQERSLRQNINTADI